MYGSELIKLLSPIHSSDVKASSFHFAEEFGQLMDLSGSMTLARVHDDIALDEFTPNDMSAKQIRDEFLKTRETMIRKLAMCFVPNTGMIRNKIPSPRELHAHFKITGILGETLSGSQKLSALAFEPFRKFYITRQNETESQIQNLRSNIREAISGLSPDLARLAQLDKAMAEAIVVRSRELFTLTVDLLGSKFKGLLKEHWLELPENPAVAEIAKWMMPGSWISRFCGEMREMLLAELSVRLFPVLGMIESLAELDVDDMHNKGKDLNCG